MDELETLLKKYNFNFHHFEDTMRRVAMTAIENGLEGNIEGAFKLMLKRDAQFLDKFASDYDFKCDVVDRIAEKIHTSINHQ